MPAWPGALRGAPRAGRAQRREQHRPSTAANLAPKQCQGTPGVGVEGDFWEMAHSDLTARYGWVKEHNRLSRGSGRALRDGARQAPLPGSATLLIQPGHHHDSSFRPDS